MDHQQSGMFGGSNPHQAVDLRPKNGRFASTVATPAFSEIENEFARLSPEDQLTLLERLVHRARVAVTARPDTWEAELSAMAGDPEMQRELSRINTEFRSAEGDGLERH